MIIMGYDIAEVFGGLALFLYGLHLLSNNLEKLASFRIQKMLETLTNHAVKGSIFGACATAILQSSSLMMVTMIGLMNANLLTLHQAVGMMLGMEIGTTMTAQLVSLNVGSLFYHIIAIGFFITFVSKNDKRKSVGAAILGLGLLFMGMKVMGAGVKTLTSSADMQALLITLNENPLLGVVIGTVFTAIIQSSSAMTGLVIAMGASNTIDLPFAISLIFGANIGTCVTGAIASIGSKLTSKRASLIQIIINVTGVLIFLPFLVPFAEFVQTTSADLPRQIANAHTIFNITVSLLMFPLIGTLVGLVKKILPGEVESVIGNVRFIDDKLLKFLNLHKFL